MRHAKAARQLPHGPGFSGGLRPQAVINGCGKKLRSRLTSVPPARSKKEQRGGIRTTGDGENDSTGIKERLKESVRLGGGNCLRALSSGHASVLVQHLV